MPHHFAVRTRPGRLAFTSQTEARALWDAVLAQVPSPLALCLMPDHVHLLHKADVSRALGLALRSHARWRNRRHGLRGPLWRRVGAPEPVKPGLKLQRSVRYIHLNPCRARLVDDPLAWPWSTHRDRVGLVVPATRRPDPDPVAFHAYVSADPSVAVQGTLLPQGIDRPRPDQVFAAVSALTRSPWSRMSRRGSARDLWLQSLRAFTELTQAGVAREAGVGLRTVERVGSRNTPELRIVGRVLGDPRFAALEEGDLRRHPRWRRYAGRT